MRYAGEDVKKGELVEAVAFRKLDGEGPLRASFVVFVYPKPLPDFTEKGKPQLISAASDGLSAVYTFFDPDLEKRSLGAFGVLTQIRLAQEIGLPYVYLGYWIAASRKMAYKAGFQPLQGLRDGHWQRLELKERTC